MSRYWICEKNYEIFQVSPGSPNFDIRVSGGGGRPRVSPFPLNGDEVRNELVYRINDMWNANPMPSFAVKRQPTTPGYQRPSVCCIYEASNGELILRPRTTGRNLNQNPSVQYLFASFKLQEITDTSPLWNPITQHRWSYRWWLATLREPPQSGLEWVEGPVETVFEGTGRDATNPNPAGYRQPNDNVLFGSPWNVTPFELMPVVDAFNTPLDEPDEPPPGWDGDWPLGDFPDWFVYTNEL